MDEITRGKGRKMKKIRERSVEAIELTRKQSTIPQHLLSLEASYKLRLHKLSKPLDHIRSMLSSSRAGCALHCHVLLWLLTSCTC